MNPFASLTGGLGGGSSAPSLTYNPIASSSSGPAWSGTGQNGSATTSLITVSNGTVGSTGIYILLAAAFIGFLLLFRA